MSRSLAVVSVVVGLSLSVFTGACVEDVGSEGADGAGEETPETSESMLTTAEKEAVCNAVPRGRAWTRAEADTLLSEVGKRAANTKRTNDALIAQRGVGGYVGGGTEFWKAIGRNDKAAAAAIIRPKLKPGHDAMRVAGEIKGTSCIGWVYTTLRDIYAGLGRASEWTAIERCGRAWDSDGLHVQQALVKNGWSSPTLGFVTDEPRLPGATSEVAIHREFLRGVAATGTYYGTPVSRTVMMKNFFPSPGSSTPLDEGIFLRLGRSTTLGFGTFRGAYHVPFIVPASAVPDDLAPAGAARGSWLLAKQRGEPFVLESHLRRQAWDPTNFEIRPLKAVIAETLSQNAIFATGTIQFAPFGAEAIMR